VSEAEVADLTNFMNHGLPSIADHFQLLKKLPPFVELKGTFTCSRKATIESCCDPVNPVMHLFLCSSKIYFSIVLLYLPRSSLPMHNCVCTHFSLESILTLVIVTLITLCKQ
jgi:hypothetical protein